MAAKGVTRGGAGTRVRYGNVTPGQFHDAVKAGKGKTRKGGGKKGA